MGLVQVVGRASVGVVEAFGKFAVAARARVSRVVRYVRVARWRAKRILREATRRSIEATTRTINRTGRRARVLSWKGRRLLVHGGDRLSALLFGLRLAAVRGWNRHSAKVGFAIFVAVMAASYFLAPRYGDQVALYFGTDELATLRSVLVTIGGTLIGATATIFSVVMLAVQVNFERTPHGLFRRLSSDPALLGCFAATSVLGGAIACSSLAPPSWVVQVILLAIWATAGSLVLFFLAYVRALTLINPATQMVLILKGVQRSMNRWERWATRASRPMNRVMGPNHPQDMARALFFRSNPQWESTARQALAHVAAFVRKYAERGEYEVSGAALVGLVSINTSYIAARKRTFFPSNPIFPNPLANEGFISDVLEQLRILAVEAQGRADERLFMQIMKCLSQLCGVYATIDYGQDHGSRLHHAQLASSYLISILEGALKIFGADVPMEGLRLMGRNGVILISGGHGLGVSTIADKMALVGITGLRPGYEPVVMTAVEQLSMLAFELLRSEERDVNHPLGSVREAVATLARVVLSTPDQPLMSRHSSNMAPYYSLATPGSFGIRLGELVNSVAAEAAESGAAKRVLYHLEEWSDGMFDGEKKLLLAAVKSRSFLAMDLISWIVHVTKALVAASNAQATTEHLKEELRKNALWLIWVLDWIPDDQESVTHVESYRLGEQLFESLMDSLSRGADEVAEAARDVLFNWAFKAGKYQTGWGSFDRALLALSLAVAWEPDSEWVDWLMGKLADRLKKKEVPDEIRERSARELRREANNRGRGEWAISIIDQALARVDRQRFANIVKRVADLIEPQAE